MGVPIDIYGDAAPGGGGLAIKFDAKTPVVATRAGKGDPISCWVFRPNLGHPLSVAVRRQSFPDN